MAYTFDEMIVSDLHKDARGFRPSEYFWEEWTQCGDDNRQAMWDGLLRELNHTMEAERAAEARAEIEFHQRVQGAMLIGAADEVTAIRWILAAEGFDEYDLAYGKDYVAFHFGLSYQNSFQDQITAALAEMKLEADQG